MTRRQAEKIKDQDDEQNSQAGNLEPEEAIDQAGDSGVDCQVEEADEKIGEAKRDDGQKPAENVYPEVLEDVFHHPPSLPQEIRSPGPTAKRPAALALFPIA
jgi:hypothetical protein